MNEPMGLGWLVLIFGLTLGFCSYKLYILGLTDKFIAQAFPKNKNSPCFFKRGTKRMMLWWQIGLLSGILIIIGIWMLKIDIDIKNIRHPATTKPPITEKYNQQSKKPEAAPRAFIFDKNY